MSNATLACTVDWAAIGAILSAVATFVVAGIAWKQLDSLNKTSKADFAHRCNTDFFTSKARVLFMLFENNMMKLHVLEDDEFAYFEIDKAKLDLNPIYLNFIDINKQIYSAYEIDDILLGPLDNVGTYYFEKLMDLVLVDNFFGYYIVNLYNNEQIKAYIKWVQSTTDNTNVYDKFEAIYSELKNKTSDNLKD